MSLSIVLFSLYIYWYSDNPFNIKSTVFSSDQKKNTVSITVFIPFPCFENDSYIMNPWFPNSVQSISAILPLSSVTAFRGIIPDLLNFVVPHLFLKIFLFINGYARSFIFLRGGVRSKRSYRSSMNCSTSASSALLVGA